MPRNSQGLYTLPAGNPVTPGTLIEANWANTTMNDLASAMTASLPRDGTAPMTGPLTLVSGNPTNGRHAANKAYVDSFLAYATGLPVGAVVGYASPTPPSGFLLCNGQAVSRATYSVLFAAIGTIFGSGDGSTTFNVPDMRDMFMRGKGASRALGSVQADAIRSHNHTVSDPGHGHNFTDPGHTHTATDSGHTHTATQAAHTHDAAFAYPTRASASGSGTVDAGALQTRATTSAQPAITVNSGTANVTLSTDTTGATASNSVTGLTVGAFGDAETRPANTAFDYYIKAVNDSTGASGILTGLTSSDPLAIEIDLSDPAIPELNIHTNVAFGLVKLDSNNKVPNNLLDVNLQTFLGTFDCSGGQNPSQVFPATNYGNGDTFVVSQPGTIDVYETDGTPVSKPIQAGWYLVFQEGLATPDGWYYIEPTVAQITATNVALSPVVGLSATNVQDGIAELESSKPDTAAEMPYSPPVGMTSNNVQDAITEVFNAAGGTPTASSVSFVPAGNITETNVQLAIQQLDGIKAPTSASTAVGTTFTPAGGIAATNVQAAIEELDTEKAPKADPVFTGNPTAPTVAWGDADTTLATTAFVDRLRDVPAQVKSAGYTLALADRGQSIDTTAGVTVPDNATVAFPVGTTITVTNTSAANITITQGANVTLRLAGTATTGDRTLAQYGMATMRKYALNSWIISGGGLT